jgi:cardiolipin synthase
MSVRFFQIRCFGCLFAILALAGCATPRQRTRYIQTLETGSITNFAAFRSGTNLLVRFPLHGKTVFAHANWMAPSDDPGYHHELAPLIFEKEERATRNLLIKKGDHLIVRDARQWQQLVREVFEGMVPSQPGHGVVLLAETHEMAVFRAANGRLTVTPLENKPPEVVVDQTFSDTEFCRRGVLLLEAGTQGLDTNRTQFLFVTGDDPAFAFIDLKQRLLVLLSYPVDPETQPLQLPAWFALRTLHSFFIRGYVLMAIRNPFTLVGRGLWHLGNSGAAAIESGGSSPGTPPPPLYTGPGMDTAAWEKRLDHVVSARRYKGTVDFLIDGEQFFPALIQSITDASRSIDVLVFIFDNDDYAVYIADLLKQHSSSIRVRVLMDELGSLFAGQVPPKTAMPPDFVPPDDIQSYLASGSRVHVRATANPWLTIDHRKCIIIDGKLAYIGGMNIGREYRSEWHDMMVGLRGPIVGWLEKDYREAWAHAGWLGDFGYFWVALFGRQNPAKLDVTNAIDIRPLRTATAKLDIYRAQLAAIQNAKSRIYIENAYFDDGMILRALIQARQRGVDVRVIVPAENDSGIMQTSNLMIANTLLQSGIRVYAYPGMTHVKAAIYDGWACLGSANFDKMSLRISQELDVAFSDPATVARLDHELFETDFARSRELKGTVPIEWLDSFVKALADQL